MESSPKALCSHAQVRGGEHSPAWLWCPKLSKQITPRIHCGEENCEHYNPEKSEEEEEEEMPKHANIQWDKPVNEGRLNALEPDMEKSHKDGVPIPLWRWADEELDRGTSQREIVRLIGCSTSALMFAITRRRELAGMPPREPMNRGPKKETPKSKVDDENIKTEPKAETKVAQSSVDREELGNALKELKEREVALDSFLNETGHKAHWEGYLRGWIAKGRHINGS